MEYYDHLETRAPEIRERTLMEALPKQIEHARRNAPYFRNLLQGVDPRAISSRKALAQLPVTNKEDLTEIQRRDPPFGGMVAVGYDQIARVFISPGPIHEIQGRRPDYGRFARALFASGFRKGDLVYNTTSYHFTPGAFLMEDGALALGCAVFPAGTGQTEAQLAAIASLRPTAYLGTPSFLRILVEKARETGADISSIAKAHVGGEAVPASLRSELAGQGIRVTQGYGNADLGLIAYETEALEGMVLGEGIILELVRPGTGDPVAEGEVGEVVITTLAPEYPLIRFATGDLSAILPGPSPCGRTNTRIKGWMGRANQTTKVKGMFVHPNQVAGVLKRHPEIIKGRLVIDQDHSRQDRMTLHCEVAGSVSGDFAAAVAQTIREICKLRGETKFVPPGSLSNDGKVIEDIRKYD